MRYGADGKAHTIDRTTMTCTLCGAPAKITSPKYLSVQCSAVRAERQAKYNKRSLLRQRERMLALHPELASAASVASAAGTAVGEDWIDPETLQFLRDEGVEVG